MGIMYKSILKERERGRKRYRTKNYLKQRKLLKCKSNGEQTVIEAFSRAWEKKSIKWVEEELEKTL